MTDPAAIPVLPRGVRVAEDALRGTTVLLGPERVLMIDPIGAAILARIDGVATLGAICENLAATYEAPLDVIAPDMDAFTRDLADKRLLDFAHG